jgi:hypothetical protein
MGVRSGLCARASPKHNTRSSPRGSAEGGKRKKDKAGARTTNYKKRLSDDRLTNEGCEGGAKESKVQDGAEEKRLLVAGAESREERNREIASVSCFKRRAMPDITWTTKL